MNDQIDQIEWMGECSVDCAICGRYTGSAVHICGFTGIQVETTCANICPACVARLAASIPTEESE